MTCANCGKPLDASYRLVAFDRPQRANVPTCGGRCNSKVRAWSGGRLELYITGQQVRTGSTRKATVEARA